MPDERCRVLRRRLARREQLVRSRTRAKNEIQAVLQRRLQGRPPCSDLFGVKGRRWLATLELPLEERESVDAGIRHVDFLDSEVAAVERLIAQQALDWPEIRRLMTVPGVNLICAATFVADVDLPDPTEGEALVDVTYSSVNYKDGLALARNPGVARVDPLVPGIDVVGTVSALGPGVHDVAIGDRIVLNGAGLGETRHGGWAQHAVVPSGSLVVLPDTIEDSFAAAIGTAVPSVWSERPATTSNASARCGMVRRCISAAGDG